MTHATVTRHHVSDEVVNPGQWHLSPDCVSDVIQYSLVYNTSYLTYIVYTPVKTHTRYSWTCIYVFGLYRTADGLYLSPAGVWFLILLFSETWNYECPPWLSSSCLRYYWLFVIFYQSLTFFWGGKGLPSPWSFHYSKQKKKTFKLFYPPQESQQNV